MENSFFAGLESFMEDDKVEASATVTVAPEEQVAEEAEAEQAATEQEETTAEIEQEEQAAEMIFAKFEEIDRMIAHVETYGVDRSFLSICNHDNVLGNSFGIALPACESFDAVGDPNSAISIAALEGLGAALHSFWEWIKKICSKIIGTIKGFLSRIFGGEKKAEKTIARVKELEKAKPVNDRCDASVEEAEIIDAEYVEVTIEAAAKKVKEAKQIVEKSSELAQKLMIEYKQKAAQSPASAVNFGAGTATIIMNGTDTILLDRLKGRLNWIKTITQGAETYRARVDKLGRKNASEAKANLKTYREALEWYLQNIRTYSSELTTLQKEVETFGKDAERFSSKSFGGNPRAIREAVRTVMHAAAAAVTSIGRVEKLVAQIHHGVHMLEMGFYRPKQAQTIGEVSTKTPWYSGPIACSNQIFDE